ncbi:MAG TPA: hypothetical protein VFL93_03685 [Longimicrobiaceae bacterium]|nr:hypothetical protein [Longimicrobiaceae bacterium]
MTMFVYRRELTKRELAPALGAGLASGLAVGLAVAYLTQLMLRKTPLRPRSEEGRGGEPVAPPVPR